MKGKTVVQDLEAILRMKRDGTYTKSDGAVLITRDASSGILTISYPGLNNEDGMKLLVEAARVSGIMGKPFPGPKETRSHATH